MVNNEATKRSRSDFVKRGMHYDEKFVKKKVELQLMLALEVFEALGH